ncbi:MAG: NAD(P)H-dependent flavin oxidoreductase, partial [Myxococcota bacterium]
MTLHTPICDILGIEHPVLLAGMGGAANPRLVAAVSEAGGLGVLGAAACGPDQLRDWIHEVRSLTDRPFGVDTLLPASVRRMSGGEPKGPSPADRLPDYRAFTREFLQREGLEPPGASEGPGPLRQPGAPGAVGRGRGREIFSKSF